MAKITATLLILCSLAAPPAMAAWNDMLNKIQEKTGALFGGDSAGAADGEFDQNTLARALRDALEVATERAVSQVSQPGGYLDNPQIRIPLPSPLDQGAEAIKGLGGAQLLENFQQSMNRAAESAAPEASAYFLDALQKMDIEHAKMIYNGPDDAATRYFERHTRERLTASMQSVIGTAMNEVNVTRYYQQIASQAAEFPMLKQMNLNLEDYVTREAVDGLFTVMAQEEKRIREDPAARTTELLKDVFGR